jgi:hypothetical protein
MWGGNINVIKKNTKALLEASRKFELHVNTEKDNECTVVPRHQNVGQNNKLLIPKNLLKMWQS